jgi:hypothetical protein
MQKPKQRLKILNFPRYLNCKVTDEQYAYLQLMDDRSEFIRSMIQSKIDRWKLKENNERVLKRKINKIKREG